MQIRTSLMSAALLALLASGGLPAAAAVHQLAAENRVQVLDQDAQGLDLALSFSELETFEVQTPRGEFTELRLPGCTWRMEVGAPKLPVWRRLIAVPLGATPQIWVTAGEATDISLAALGVQHPLMPTQAPLSKSVAAAEAPFVWNQDAYLRGNLEQAPAVRLLEQGILRSERLVLVEVSPVQLDPQAGLLRVHNNLQLHVSFPGADWAATEELRARTRSPYFESIFSRQILNHGQDAERDAITEYPVKFVIVAHPDFAGQLAPFIEWKTRKGFQVITGYIGDANVGATTASIKNWLQGLYNAATPASPAPSFVLYVGDDNLVPTWSGDTDSHVTDLDYVLYSGGDYLPEVLYGRFSARNAGQLQPQIDKTLEYEQYLMPDPNYLGRCVMIAGVDAGMAPTYGNGQINYGVNNYFNAAHGISSNTYLYPASDGAGVPAAVVAHASEGRGYMNYTAHGSETAWADPSFTIANINSLANNHKYGTVVGNCCLTNSFQVETCFGEAWLRAADKGAIGYIGGSNSTYWSEDYWWGVGAGPIVGAGPDYEDTGLGMYDCAFHDHGEAFADWHTTQGAMNVAGNLAVVEGGSGMAAYYWEIYHLMGDPSLSTWMNVPAENDATLPEAIFLGQSSVTIVAEPYSYVGLSMNGVLRASGLVPASGSLELAITPFTTAGDADLVLTHHQKQPLITTVPVVPDDGAYVTLAAYSPAAGEQGATVSLSGTLENIGTVAAADVQTTLTLNHPFVTIADGSQAFGTIAAGASATQAGAWTVQLLPGIPDQELLQFALSVSGTVADTWISSLEFTTNAPDPVGGPVVIDDAAGGDGNGRLDPGETAWLRWPLSNAGHAGAGAGTATIATASPWISVLTGSEALAALPAGGAATADFQIQVDAATPSGTVASFTYAYTAGAYGATVGEGYAIGLLTEDFETGNLLRFPWQAGGTAGWSTVSAPHAGVYAARSGAITHDQTSELNLTATVQTEGILSFWYKVSSEDDYDYLIFAVDGTEVGSWSGTVDWTQCSTTVGAGAHTFRWIYSKDVSVDSGSDCAWVDDIIFPAITLPPAPAIAVAPASLETVVEPGGISSESLSVTNAGLGELHWHATVQTLGRPSSLPFLKLGKGAADPRVGSCGRDAGGPDVFGYTWTDSHEPGGPAYSWVDISGVGTNVGTGDDNNFGPFNLGFSFDYYGNSFSSVRVCSNGWLSFTSSADAYDNQGLPSAADPNNLLAVFWDDLNVTAAGMLKYHADAANQRFIVSWLAVPRWNTTQLETFQVILHADGRIVYQYNSMNGTLTEASVGIENSGGTDGLEVVANAAYVTNGLAVQFRAEAPWLVLSPTAGTVAPGGAATVTADFSALELTEGSYEAIVTVTSNDPLQPTVTVPVTMVVGAITLEAPVIQISNPSNCTTHLSWPAVPNATSYRIWSRTSMSGTWSLEATTPYLFYNMNCITDGLVKIYRVTAVHE